MVARLLMHQDDIDKDRPGWLRARQTGITASEISAVVGLAPKSYNASSPFALYVAKVNGGRESTGDTDETLRGTHLEPYVADVFAALHPDLEVYPGGLYCSRERPWQMATFDRLAVDEAGLLTIGGLMSPDLLPGAAVMPVQIKTSATKEGYGEPGTASIPVHYRAQALWELDIADARTVLVPVLFMQEWQVKTYIIDRDDDVEADLKFMRAEAEMFLDRVVNREPPPIDWMPATTAALKTLHSPVEEVTVVLDRELADRYREARRATKAAEIQMGLATNLVMAAMGKAKYGVTVDDNGREAKVATRAQFPRTDLDQKGLRAQRPDVAKEFERTRPQDSLFPGTWSKG